MFGKKEIPQIFEHLAALEHDSPLQSLQEQIYKDCRDSEQACLMRFVTYQRRLSDKLITDAITPVAWSTIAKEPVSMTGPVRAFIGDINRLNDEIPALFDLTKPLDSRENDPLTVKSRSMLRSGSFQTGTVVPTFFGVRDEEIHEVERLFTSVNRLHLNRPTRFAAQSVISSILMYPLKTMLELVRLNWFSSQGFNQIQVDVYAIYKAFTEKVDEPDLFAALVEEIVSSAADRTFDPVPLDVAALMAISSDR
jgi:hypothetical protein